ncbi:MAG: 2TM domain-containing protein [Prochloraceae cyanobacterium]
MFDRYNNEQVQEILTEATKIEKDGDISREEFKEIAAEVGISAKTLEKAEKAWLEKHKVNQKKASRRKAFIRFHLIPYLAVSGFLVTLNLTTTPNDFWSVYPILGWGLGVTIDGSCVR